MKSLVSKTAKALNFNLNYFGPCLAFLAAVSVTLTILEEVFMFSRLALVGLVLASACTFSPTNSATKIAEEESSEEEGGSLISLSCGQDINEDGEVLDAKGNALETPELVFASESYPSQKPEKWVLEIGGKEVKNFKLARTEKNDRIEYTALVAKGQTVGGIVGSKYVFDISQCESNNYASAKRIEVGGFAGGTTTKQYKCSCSMD